MKREKQLTSIRYGRNNIDIYRGEMDVKTIKKYKKNKSGESRTQEDVGQFKTTARDYASRDLWGKLKFACVIMSAACMLPSLLKWNADATAYLCHVEGNGTLMCRVITYGEPTTPLESTRYQEGLAVIIKWMHLCNANGDFGPTVLVIATQGMAENSFHHEEVVGLTNGTDSTQVGHIYFCDKRCIKGTEGTGSQNGWNHWWEHVVIPTLAKYSEAHKILDNTWERLHSCLTIDGEDVVIKELFSPNIIPLLYSNKIIVVKGSPSDTADDNANDASNNFKNSKEE